MGAAGLSRAGLAGIFGLEPVRRAVGRAFTVRFEPADAGFESRGEYLGETEPGDVLVLDNGGRTYCSVWGGQRSVGAIQRGVAAAVVNGAYRDVEEHRGLDFPVYGIAPTIVGSTGSVVPVAVGETLRIGDVRVAPRDWVVADGSGVIVIPADRVDEVAEGAEQVRAEEARVSGAVADGIDFVSFRADVRAGRV
jgi:regulator of RNase E activity RraA